MSGKLFEFNKRNCQSKNLLEWKILCVLETNEDVYAFLVDIPAFLGGENEYPSTVRVGARKKNPPH